MIDLDKYATEFNYLENLRKSGITNMFGAAPYIAKDFALNTHDAREILQLWMRNYESLANKYGW